MPRRNHPKHPRHRQFPKLSKEEFWRQEKRRRAKAWKLQGRAA
jgi:hypothetical protein